VSLSDHQRDAYDQLADAYAHAYSEPRSGAFNYNLDLAIPRLLEAVGPVAGLTVLDAGCGEGIVSRLLQGAAQIVGIDFSSRLIAYARERATTDRIIYEVHDLSRPLPHYRQYFDLVVSNLVLNDVADYTGFITTLSDVVKPLGRIVLNINNPYSAVLREKVDNYFRHNAATHYAFGPVYYYHRTMEAYITAFSAAGLCLQRLYDIQMTEEMVERLPEANRAFPWYSFYHRFPFMIILDFVKRISPPSMP
jgi:2-polyprenyl-3-methyl-5-hydroxy-6-metoxy-1,4-benzoquinol methylase